MKNTIVAKTAVVYYHRNCVDGEVSNYIARESLHRAGFIVTSVAVGYYDNFQALFQKKKSDYIFVLDFSFPKELSDDLAKRCDQFVFLDHHDSAAEKHGGYGCVCHPGFFQLLRKDKSGAGLTLQYFQENAYKFDCRIFVNDPRLERVVQLVQDRDLFRFAYGDETRKLNIIFQREKLTYERIKFLIEGNDGEWDNWLNEAGAILEYQKEVVKNIAKFKQLKKILYNGEEVLVNVVNSPVQFCSDVAAFIYTKEPEHPVIVWADGNYINVNVRSHIDSKVSAKQVAECYGGGGHREAAGCKFSSLQEFLKIFV